MDCAVSDMGHLDLHSCCIDLLGNLTSRVLQDIKVGAVRLSLHKEYSIGTINKKRLPNQGQNDTCRTA